MFAATFSLPPSINSTYKSGMRNGHSVFYKSLEAKNWSKEVLWLTKNKEPVLGNCEVSLSYFFPANNFDIDGRIKITLDTLQGIAFENDRQVMRLSVEKKIDKENPRVSVEVREMV